MSKLLQKPVVLRVVGTIFLGRVEMLMLLMPIYRNSPLTVQPNLRAIKCQHAVETNMNKYPNEDRILKNLLSSIVMRRIPTDNAKNPVVFRNVPFKNYLQIEGKKVYTVHCFGG